MSSWDAAKDINLGHFDKWMDSERLAVSVDSIYRELNNDTSPRDLPGLIGRCAELEQIYLKRKAGGCSCSAQGH